MISLPHGGASFKKRSLESDILGLRNWLSLSGFQNAMVEKIITLFELKNVWDLMNLSDEKILNSNLMPWHQEALVEARMGDVKNILTLEVRESETLKKELKIIVDENERTTLLYQQALRRLRVELDSCRDENKNFKDEIRVLKNQVPNAQDRGDWLPFDSPDEDMREHWAYATMDRTPEGFNPYAVNIGMHDDKDEERNIQTVMKRPAI